MAPDKNTFFSFKNTSKDIARNITQKINANNKSLGQFKYKHILFLPQPPAKIINYNSGLRRVFLIFILIFTFLLYYNFFFLATTKITLSFFDCFFSTL